MPSEEQLPTLGSELSPEPATVGPSGPGERRRWRPLRGLAPAALILPLALIAAVILLLAGPLGLGKKASPTQTAQVLGQALPNPSAGVGQTRSAAGAALEAGKAPGTATPPVTPISPELYLEWLEQARGLVLESRFEDAIGLYQELARQSPDDPEPERGWAWALILDGLADQALPHALRAVELDPLEANSMAVLARAYAETGDIARALGMAQNAVKLAPRSAEANAMLAAAYLLDGQTSLAVEPAEAALQWNPASAEAHCVRGRIYAQVEDNPAQALAELERAAELEPQLWSRHHELGLLRLEVGDLEGATLSFKQALALRPQTVTYTAIGDAYYRLGEDDRSRSFLGQALSAGAQDVGTFALLAAIDARRGSCGDAQVYWEQALAVDPANQLALQAQRTCQAGTPAAAVSATPAESAPTTAPTAGGPPPVALAGWIAFPLWDPSRGDYDTYVARADGSDRRLAVTEAHQPAFSPDGAWLAVNGERQNQENLLLVRPDGADLREVTEHVEDGQPAWSPNGQALVYSSTQHGDRQSRLYLLDPLPADGKRAAGRPLQSDSTDLLGTHPAWAAGGQIVYSGCVYEGASADCGLFFILAEPGSEVAVQLTHDPADTAPAVSGGQIAFMSRREGNWELYAINLDGTGLRRLTDDPAQDGLPTWSPDSRTLAFVSDRGGTWAVWAMRPDGSTLRKLFDLDGSLGPDWNREKISWGP